MHKKLALALVALNLYDLFSTWYGITFAGGEEANPIANGIGNWYMIVGIKLVILGLVVLASFYLDKIRYTSAPFLIMQGFAIVWYSGFMVNNTMVMVS